jgi:sialate O-acetylesterase
MDTHDGKPPTDFEVAGADGQFAPAQAEITDEFTARIWSPAVARPVAVRFAWRETAQPNLINGAGLPGFPFRTNAPVWSGADPGAKAQTPVAP